MGVEAHPALLAAERAVLAVDRSEAALLLVRDAGLEGEDVRAALLVLLPILGLLAPLEVVLAKDLEVADVSLDEEAAREGLLGEAASTRRAFGILGKTLGDAREAKEMAVLALSRLVEDLQADGALQLLRRVLVDYKILELEGGLRDRRLDGGEGGGLLLHLIASSKASQRR